MLSGIKINRTLISVYALAGLICGFAGWVAAGRVGSISPIGFTDINLASITAVVIGGTSLAGGVGKIYGAILGALVMQSLQSGMVLIGFDSAIQRIVVGVVLVLAVYLDILYNKRVK